MAPGLIGITAFGSQLDDALGGAGHFNLWPIAGAIALIAVVWLFARRLARTKVTPGQNP